MNSEQRKKYFVGIDISKDSFDATLIDQFQKKLFYQKFEMNKSGFKSFLHKLARFDKALLQITVESTGVYFVSLYNYLLNAGFSICVINPLLVHNFHKSMSLRKTKTDKKDSFTIALFTLKNLEILSKHNKQTSTMRRLCRERDKISEEIAKVKTEIKSDMNVLFPELEKHIELFSKSMLLFLEKHSSPDAIRKLRTSQINAIFNKTKGNKVRMKSVELKKLARNSIGSGDKYLQKVLSSKIQRLKLYQELSKEFDLEIAAYIEQNQSTDFDILTSIKGIGEITAQKFLIEVDEIRNFNNHKQLTAFMGTDPSLKQSGSSIMYQGKISKRGNKYLRKTLFQMAVNCIRNNSTFNAYYHKKRDEEKKYKQAVIATGNKLVRVIYSMLTKRNYYCEDYR